MTDNTPCDYCGACCKTFPIFAGDADAEIEPRIKSESCKVAEWEASNVKRFQLHPLPFNNKCCFLGEDNLCSVYQSRPSVCRKFEPGSIQCNEARSRIGLAPLL